MYYIYGQFKKRCHIMLYIHTYRKLKLNTEYKQRKFNLHIVGENSGDTLYGLSYEQLCDFGQIMSFLLSDFLSL